MTCPQIWSFYLFKSLRFRCSYEQTQFNSLIKHIYTLCGRKWFHLLFIYLFSMLKVLCRMWGYKNLQLLVIIWRIVKFSVVMADFTWNLKFYGKKTLAAPKFPLLSTENLFAFLILLVFSCCFSLIFFSRVWNFIRQHERFKVKVKMKTLHILIVWRASRGGVDGWWRMGSAWRLFSMGFLLPRLFSPHFIQQIIHNELWNWLMMDESGIECNWRRRK